MSNPIRRSADHAHRAALAAARRSTLLLRLHRAQLHRAALPAARPGDAIIFSTPFMVALLGGPMLGEWIDWRRWTAIIVGFCGVLLVTRPAPAASTRPRCSSPGAACYAIYSISTRILAHRLRPTRPTSIPIWSARVGRASSVPFVWTPQSDRQDHLLMCSMGLFSGLGHYLLISATASRPPPCWRRSSTREIVWMIALGFLVFGDVPNHWTLAGVAVVIASGSICSTASA
jgi:drug/metabolite transporter (DMT)-like permease